jgi:hypothetical protein
VSPALLLRAWLGAAPAAGAAPGPEPEAFAREVLPCGLDVVVARDTSLPVAAVVLALEVGTEQDPPDQPGLIHALAYHLLQGTRELKPGEALAAAHDHGGRASMAIGAGQIRFEALVPVSRLDRMLWVEAQRLRAVTVSAPLWKDTLTHARGDRRPRAVVPPAVIAAGWDREALARDGTAVPPALAELPVEVVAREIAERFTYARATLVVVSPRDPEATVRAIAALFADLPAVPRSDPPSALPDPPAHGRPRAAAIEGARGDTLVWPIASEPHARVWAEIVCAALERQRRTPDEPGSTRVRCHVQDDPRRAVMAVRVAGGVEPVELLRRRLARLADGTDDRALGHQRDRVRRRWRAELHQPLSLARRLAQLAPTTAPERLLDALRLDDLRAGPSQAPRLFDPSAATLLVAAQPPEGEKGTP